jgi:hypothetical protein
MWRKTMSDKDTAVMRTMTVMMSGLFGLFVVMITIARMIAY